MIRNAIQKDISEIIAIVDDVNSLYDEQFLKNLISNDKGILFVVEDSGKIISVLAAQQQDIKGVWLFFMIVKKDYHGQDYEEQLLEALEKETQKRGCKTIALETTLSAFFSTYGFHESGRMPNDIDGVTYSLMWKEV